MPMLSMMPWIFEAGYFPADHSVQFGDVELNGFLMRVPVGRAHVQQKLAGVHARKNPRPSWVTSSLGAGAKAPKKSRRTERGFPGRSRATRDNFDETARIRAQTRAASE